MANKPPPLASSTNAGLRQDCEYYAAKVTKRINEQSGHLNPSYELPILGRYLDHVGQATTRPEPNQKMLSIDAFLAQDEKGSNLSGNEHRENVRNFLLRDPVIARLSGEVFGGKSSVIVPVQSRQVAAQDVAAHERAIVEMNEQKILVAYTQAWKEEASRLINQPNHPGWLVKNGKVDEVALAKNTAYDRVLANIPASDQAGRDYLAQYVAGMDQHHNAGHHGKSGDYEKRRAVRLKSDKHPGSRSAAAEEYGSGGASGAESSADGEDEGVGGWARKAGKWGPAIIGLMMGWGQGGIMGAIIGFLVGMFAGNLIDKNFGPQITEKFNSGVKAVKDKFSGPAKAKEKETPAPEKPITQDTPLTELLQNFKKVHVNQLAVDSDYSNSLTKAEVLAKLSGHSIPDDNRTRSFVDTLFKYADKDGGKANGVLSEAELQNLAERIVKSKSTDTSPEDKKFREDLDLGVPLSRNNRLKELFELKPTNVPAPAPGSNDKAPGGK
ncbi:MAG: EF-hand domain-containing protein [Alphaproteobacteria bacterium]|nr:EF-hand domain-containing protein [Alphaproteobacteria bacterium]